jgi:HD-GYP domain-containing protein (c-di-GMP phosphodiesterase class II)
VQLLVRWHHEWWNGGGYPDALAGESIPLAARILRIADTYAALTDARPYSVAISSDEARRYLIEWAGIEFDPRIVMNFLALEDLEELRSYGDIKETAEVETAIEEGSVVETESAPIEEGKSAAAERQNKRTFELFNDFIE